MNALFCIVNPIDRPTFDDDFLWEQCKDALESVAGDESTFERLPLPTETALAEVLSRRNCDVLHIASAAPERDALTHATVPLVASDKRLRHLSVKHFASLLADYPSVKLVVLQATGSAKQSFSAVARELVELGVPAVVAAPSLRGRALNAFIATLYAGLFSGAAASQLAQSLSALSNNAAGDALTAIEAHAKDPDRPIFPAMLDATKTSASTKTNPPAAHTPSSAGSATSATPLAQNDRAANAPTPLAGAAFLSYCRIDSEFALRLAQRLTASGAEVWIDQRDIRPGARWDQAVQAALSKCSTVLVILSPSSAGSENVLDEISYAIEKKKRVLPILYRDCDVPLRLARLQYIDFRHDDDFATATLLAALGHAPDSPRPT